VTGDNFSAVVPRLAGGAVDYDTLIDNVNGLLQQASGLQSELAASGQVTFATGLAQDVIPTIDGQASLIQDIYGANFYSTDRAGLLTQYYNALADGGQADVLIGQSSQFMGGAVTPEMGARAFDTVTLADGSTQDLYEYLAQNYPNSFQIGYGKGSDWNTYEYLIITPDPNMPTLNLGLQIDTSNMTIYTGSSGYTFPTGVNYTIRPPGP
jgi:hypothetical protein